MPGLLVAAMIHATSGESAGAGTGLFMAGVITFGVFANALPIARPPLV